MVEAGTVLSKPNPRLPSDSKVEWPWNFEAQNITANWCNEKANIDKEKGAFAEVLGAAVVDSLMPPGNAEVADTRRQDLHRSTVTRIEHLLRSTLERKSSAKAKDRLIGFTAELFTARTTYWRRIVQVHLRLEVEKFMA